MWLLYILLRTALRPHFHQLANNETAVKVETTGQNCAAPVDSQLSEIYEFFSCLINLGASSVTVGTQAKK